MKYTTTIILESNSDEEDTYATVICESPKGRRVVAIKEVITRPLENSLIQIADHLTKSFEKRLIKVN